MQYRISCQDGIQEGLETLRDLRSYNMTDAYMSGLENKIKAVEKNAHPSRILPMQHLYALRR